jgi:hypothetical protein
MNRRRFLNRLSLLGAVPLLNACARATGIGAFTAKRPEASRASRDDDDAIWRDGAAYARWTPSPHNIQPWKLRVRSATECDLLYDPTRLLPITDPTSAFTIMGLVMFVEYLSIAVRPHGVQVDATYEERALDYTATEPTLFARLRLVPARDGGTVERRVILERQTSRLPYDGSPVDEATLSALTALSATHGYRFTASSDESLVDRMVDLNRFTLFRDLDDGPTRTELRRWIRTTDESARQTQDGLWSHCLRFPGWLLQAFFDDHRKWGRGWRAKVCGDLLVRGMNGTRTVAWISGPFSTPRDWIAAGTLLGRMWLVLADRGVQMHPFGSVITNPEAHKTLVADVQHDVADHPLWFLCRLGRSAAPPRSYRVDSRSIFLDSHTQG